MVPLILKKRNVTLLSAERDESPGFPRRLLSYQLGKVLGVSLQPLESRSLNFPLAFAGNGEVGTQLFQWCLLKVEWLLF